MGGAGKEGRARQGEATPREHAHERRFFVANHLVLYLLFGSRSSSSSLRRPLARAKYNPDHDAVGSQLLHQHDFYFVYGSTRHGAPCTADS